MVASSFNFGLNFLIIGGYGAKTKSNQSKNIFFRNDQFWMNGPYLASFLKIRW
jgi:hypothetical protein